MKPLVSMSIWKGKVSVEEMNQRGEGTLSAYLNIVFTEIGDRHLKAVMPVAAKVLQPYGIMHGGASCVLAETVGSFAANYCVDREKKHCVGLDINTNHIRSIKEGLLTAIASPFHIGRQTHVWSIEIRDEKQQLISVTRLTVCVLEIDLKPSFC